MDALLTVGVQQGDVAAIKVSWHALFSVHAFMKVIAKISGQGKLAGDEWGRV